MSAQQQAKSATMLAQQQWRHLRIDDSDNAIMTRPTIAIMTMAKTPVH
jgi:hypothetical protein